MATNEQRSHEERLISEASTFLGLITGEGAKVSSDRRGQVIEEIRATGTYVHTEEELTVGAQVAWRNAGACVGRAPWRTLNVLDRRTASSPDAIFDVCVEHLRLAFNHGRIRPTVSILAPLGGETREPALLNPFLLRYAGYRTPEGIVGDPEQEGLTGQAIAAGWRNTGGSFDVLPLLVDSGGHHHLAEIPPDARAEVTITHPEYPMIEELGLRWFAMPTVSDMNLTIGGITYPCPFTGWYVVSEIAAVNLGGLGRYNVAPRVAEAIGRRGTRLDLDRALLVLTEAVVWSYDQAGIRLIDHHQAAREFSVHTAREAACGRTVSADPAWISASMSPTLLPTFRMAGVPQPIDAPAFGRRAGGSQARCPVKAPGHDILR